MQKITPTLENQLDFQERKIRSIYISTYLPRKCGIASFTKDLTNAMNLLNPLSYAEILAVTKDGEEDFPWEVKVKIREQDLKSYLDAADYINQSSADFVNLQHEFGIFGGNDGGYILELTSRINKPLITTLHTVLSEPSDNQLRIIKKLASQSQAIIVMVETARERLINVFGIPEEKIVVIHHGVPDIPYGSEDYFKKELGIGERPVISAINLLSENKGIEYVIQALPAIVKKFPKLLFLIIGQTHPEVLKTDGEKYRDYLQSLVKKLNLKKNVKFINEYIPLEDLITYLRATDIYVTPYLDPQQTSSGTLAYALGAGKVCLSTGYLYAQEVLADGRGIIVPFKDSGAIAQEIEEVLANPRQMEIIKRNAYTFGRLMIWPQVALQNLDLMRLIQKRSLLAQDLKTGSTRSVKYEAAA